MNRKYIDDLGIKYENTPQGGNPQDKRQERWKKEREIYGFDERETWSLDYSLELWLYERLSMFNEITEGTINKTFHKFIYKDKEITQQDCIDMILENLKYILTEDEYKDRELYYNSKQEIYEILALCHNSLWW
jgi:hypothetical protein